MPRDLSVCSASSYRAKIGPPTAFSRWWHTEQQQGRLSLVTFERHEAGTSTVEPCQLLPKKAAEAGGGRKEELFEVEDRGEKE